MDQREITNLVDRKSYGAGVEGTTIQADDHRHMSGPELTSNYYNTENIREINIGQGLRGRAHLNDRVARYMPIPPTVIKNPPGM